MLIYIEEKYSQRLAEIEADLEEKYNELLMVKSEYFFDDAPVIGELEPLSCSKAGVIARHYYKGHTHLYPFSGLGVEGKMTILREMQYQV